MGELGLTPKPVLLASTGAGSQGGGSSADPGVPPLVAQAKPSSCPLCWASPLAPSSSGPCSPLRSGISTRTHVSIPGPHHECSGPLYHHPGEPSKASGGVGSPGRGPDLRPCSQVPPASGSPWWQWLPRPPQRAVAPTTASGAPRAPPAPPAAWRSAQPGAPGATRPALAQPERLSSHQLGTTDHELTPGPQPFHSTKDGPCPLPLSQRPAASGGTSLEHLGVPPPHPAEPSSSVGLGYGCPGPQRDRTLPYMSTLL